MKTNLQRLCFTSITVASLFIAHGCSQEQAKESSTEPAAKATGVKFSCDKGTVNGTQTFATNVINDKLKEPLTVINWDPNNNHFGEKWTPEERCETVSQKFQVVHNRHEIVLTTDVAGWIPETNINVVCGVENKGDRCEEKDLLFTLQTDDDPNEVLQEMIAFREKPSETVPLTRGGAEATSFEDGKRIYYDLAEQIEKAKATSNTPAF